MSVGRPRKPVAEPVRGRGAAGNPEGRFESLRRVRDERAEVGEGVSAADYGTDCALGRADESEEDVSGQGLPTQVTLQRAASIISRNESPDIPFTQSINPYQGCEHGCIYCYARPSHGYLGLSPGLDFETRLFAKTNAAELLRTELARPGYRCSVISLGANTDPYQPVERELRLTRAVLEVLRECRHPVGIVTKSALIERDADILSDMARLGLVHVFISVGTLDAAEARRLEPRATAPWRRLRAVRALAQAGVPCGVFAAPLIPFINDRDLEALLEAAAASGATMAGYVILRLPFEVKDLFRDWLERHHPLRAAHVMARVRDMRGGRDNVSEFGTRMRGEGEFAELMRRRFEIACRRFGLNAEARNRLDTSQFRPPVGLQGDLFREA